MSLANNVTDERLGYTGKYTAEHITTHLPTNLKWALAGRSRDKLEKLAAEIKPLNPDRQQPGEYLAFYMSYSRCGPDQQRALEGLTRSSHKYHHAWIGIHEVLLFHDLHPRHLRPFFFREI